VLYEIKALGGDGRVVVLRVDAAREADARHEVQLQGLSVFQLRALRGAGGLGARRGRPSIDVTGFAHELLTLLRAGLTLVSALEAVAEKEGNAQARATVEGLLQRLRRGSRFSEALSASEAQFPEIFIAGVVASERSGSLDESLERYISYAGQLDVARKKIVAALIYPCLLVAVGLLVTLFLMLYVVPKFAAVYRESGSDIPWASALLLDMGRVIGGHPEAMLSGLAALAAVSAAVFSRPTVRAALGEAARQLPLVGPRLHVYELARLYRTLSMLLRSGTPAVKAFAMASRMLSRPMQARLARTSALVSQGQPISHALETTGLTTPVGVRMLRVGERGGGMADMLGRIADYHDEDIARWVDWVTRLFEPLMMAVLGIVIGAIVILLYMPIFDLAGSVK
jgi:general secretion pathway protein F